MLAPVVYDLSLLWLSRSISFRTQLDTRIHVYTQSITAIFFSIRYSRLVLQREGPPCWFKRINQWSGGRRDPFFLSPIPSHQFISSFWHGFWSSSSPYLFTNFEFRLIVFLIRLLVGIKCTLTLLVNAQMFGIHISSWWSTWKYCVNSQCPVHSHSLNEKSWVWFWCANMLKKNICITLCSKMVMFPLNRSLLCDTCACVRKYWQ